MPVLNMHFFCRLLVDIFERHLSKKAGEGREIRTLGTLSRTAH